MHKPRGLGRRCQVGVPCGGGRCWVRQQQLELRAPAPPFCGGGGVVTAVEATGFLLVFRCFVGDRPFPMARHCHKNHPWEGNLSSPCREAGPGPILPPAGDSQGRTRVPPGTPAPRLPPSSQHKHRRNLPGGEAHQPGSGALPATHPRVNPREPGRAAGSPQGLSRPHARGCVHSPGK